MALLVLGLVLLLAIATPSDATYCLCTAGNDTGAFQRNIDYACGNGADCSAILQNGVCYNPNTLLDHCNYAVNSYYQRRGQVQGSCVFSGTASVSQNPPSSVATGCVYQASPSTGTPTTGSPPTTGTPTTGSPPTTGGTTSPPTGGSTTNPGGFTPGTLVPPGSTGTGGITTLGPTGFDPTNAGLSLSIGHYTFMLMSYAVAHLLSGLVWQS